MSQQLIQRYKTTKGSINKWLSLDTIRQLSNEKERIRKEILERIQNERLDRLENERLKKNKKRSRWIYTFDIPYTDDSVRRSGYTPTKW